MRAPVIAAACALAAAVALGDGARTRPAGAAPNRACAQALAYERASANDSNSAQARYDSTIAGLAANEQCTDSQMKLVNEAFLLSMRAPAAHDLHIGDWQRDFTRANLLLTQCSNWRGLRGTQTGHNCLTQRRYNETAARQMAAETQTPAPASPQPAASGAPKPVIAPPPTPIPSPRP